MICHRSEKHATGTGKYIDFKDISENIMFIPPISDFTEFKKGNLVLLFREGDYKHCDELSYEGSGIYLVPPPGTVFTITQDSLK